MGIEGIRAPGFTTLQALVGALRAQPGKRENYERVFHNIDFGSSELERFCLFSERFYTRNLIARTETFELLTLCWAPSQKSPIHDHAGSDGWIRCARGAIEEARFHPVEADGAPGFEKIGDAELRAGESSYINDDVAWHVVGNPGPDFAVTLHLYAPPIDACQYFDADRSTIETKKMRYFSEHGHKVN